ncbi:MAG: hypothetical protein QOH13_412, partial [Thermoleophilaceae bacterium]|nr:hypothetical protein [Thermoleophilaceae bacterium]
FAGPAVERVIKYVGLIGVGIAVVTVVGILAWRWFGGRGGNREND